MNDTMNTGDKLLCTSGNDFYSEGAIYTVGRVINDKYFQLMTDCNKDHWYATVDDAGIRVCFNSMGAKHNDAWFDKVCDESSA